MHQLTIKSQWSLSLLLTCRVLSFSDLDMDHLSLAASIQGLVSPCTHARIHTHTHSASWACILSEHHMHCAQRHPPVIESKMLSFGDTQDIEAYDRELHVIRIICRPASLLLPWWVVFPSCWTTCCLENVCSSPNRDQPFRHVSDCGDPVLVHLLLVCQFWVAVSSSRCVCDNLE